MSSKQLQNFRQIQFLFVALIGVIAAPLALAEEAIAPTPPPAPSFPVSLSWFSVYKATSGRYDPYGDFTPASDGSSNSVFINTLSASVPLTPLLEASVSLPFTRVAVTAPGMTTTSFAVGGPGLDLAYKVESIVNITLKAGVSLPFQYLYQNTNGETSTQNRDAEGEDIRGSSGVTTGFELAKKVGDFKVKFESKVFFTFHYAVDSVDGPPGEPQIEIRKGNRYTNSESVSYPLSKEWSVSSKFTQLWFMDNYADGVDLTGTAGRNFTTSLGVSRGFNGWRLNLGYTTQFPFTMYSVNQPYGAAYTVGIILGG